MRTTSCVDQILRQEHPPSSQVDPAQLLSKPTLPTPAVHLSVLDKDLGNKRFNTYYEQLEGWNDEGIGDYWELMEKINCLSSLPEELEKRGLDARRLKMRLVGIHYCFMQLNGLLRAKKAAEGTKFKVGIRLFTTKCIKG